MNIGEPSDEHVAEIMERAIQLAEQTLEETTRIVIAQIRKAVETSSHVEAAERDIRSTLRQLVMIQREWYAKSAHQARLSEHIDVIEGQDGGEGDKDARVGWR